MADEEKSLGELEKFAAQIANDDQTLAAAHSLARMAGVFFEDLLQSGAMNREEALLLTGQFVASIFAMTKR